jgi:large subunit ribosomal protein L9
MNELRETAAARRAALENEMEALAVQIESIVLEFPVRAGSSGRLYGSVTTADIAEALEERLGVEIDHRQVGERPLRELGEYDVPVRLAIGQSAKVKVFLYPEGELSPSEKAAQEAEEAAREEEEAENMAAEADAEATQSEIEQYYEAEEEEEEFLIE